MLAQINYQKVVSESFAPPLCSDYFLMLLKSKKNTYRVLALLYLNSPQKIQMLLVVNKTTKYLKGSPPAEVDTFFVRKWHASSKKGT